MKAFLIISAVLALFLGALFLLARPRIGPRVETVTLSAGRDEIRHEVFEIKQIMGGARHVISVRAAGQKDWRELIEFDYDDPRRANESNFRLSPLPGGAYALLLGWKMALSPGPGRPDWIFWSAGRDLANWECCNYGLLKNVSLELEGSGRLELNPIPQRSGETRYLFTHDHGLSWRAR